MQCNSKPNMNVKNKISLLDDNSFKNIIETSNTWVDISKKIGYSTVMSSFLKKEVKKRCAQLNLSLNINSNTNKKIGLRTKGEVFNGRKNWQSARGAIRKHALFVYKKSNKPFVCAICGYDKGKGLYCLFGQWCIFSAYARGDAERGGVLQIYSRK